MFFGGQTVTFGKVISDIGLVSIVVVMGLSSHAWNDWYMMTPAPVKPPITVITQNSLIKVLLDVAIYDSPCIVEDSRNDPNPFMVNGGLHLVPTCCY